MNTVIKFRRKRSAPKQSASDPSAPDQPAKWPAYLGKPVDPMEIVLAYRALSVLHSMDVRDPRGLTKAEAIDVLRWNRQPV